MTATTTVPEPDEPPPAPSRTKHVVIALIVVVLVAIGIKFLVGRWVRSGGARRAITGLAEEGAVKVADAVVDQVLGAP